MIRYIKSELYRIVHSKGVYLLVAICAGILLAMNLVLYFSGLNSPDFPYANTSFSFSMIGGSAAVVFIMTLCLGSIIFADEYKNKTIINSIAYGYSKVALYVGKVIVGAMVSFVSIVVVLAVAIGSAYLLLENGGTEALIDMLNTYLYNIPILLTGEVGAFTLFYLLGSQMGATWSWLGVFCLVPTACQLLGLRFTFFAELDNWLAYEVIGKSVMNEVTGDYMVYVLTSEGMQRALQVGIMGVVVFLVIGCVGMCKKEVR